MVVAMEGLEGFKDEGVIPSHRYLNLLSKNNTNSSHDGDETPEKRQADGLRVALIMLKRVFGLEQFLLIISVKCQHFAYYQTIITRFSTLLLLK